MPTNSHQARSIFLNAVENVVMEKWPDFLNEACGDDRQLREHVQRLADYLRNFRGLTPIGRYGTFKYNNQEHSILMGILAAENILDDRAHDLWSVNTDYETYQEEALITETGLVSRPARHGAAGDPMVFAGPN